MRYSHLLIIIHSTVSNELFCKAGRQGERLTWSAGAGSLGRRRLDKGSSFFALLSVRYPLSSSPVRPVPPCFFFFPWFPFCSSPLRCLRFPVSHGFLCFLGFSSFVRLPTVFPFLLVFLYILYSLLCSGFFLVPSVSLFFCSSLFFFAGSFFLSSSSSFFRSGLSLAFYRARTTGCSPVRLFFSGRRISLAGGVSLLLGLGHEIRSLSPRYYDLHEDKDWSFCFGRAGMPSFQLSFPSLQAFQLQKKKNKKNSAYGNCVVLVWDWPFSIWSLKFRKFSFKPLIF